MQRTVKQYTFHYADVEKVYGEIVVTEKSVTIKTEFQQEKAYKVACKMVGYKFNPIDVECKDVLYIMDDETFFKYATIKE